MAPHHPMKHADVETVIDVVVSHLKIPRPQLGEQYNRAAARARAMICGVARVVGICSAARMGKELSPSPRYGVKAWGRHQVYVIRERAYRDDFAVCCDRVRSAL